LFTTIIKRYMKKFRLYFMANYIRIILFEADEAFAPPALKVRFGLSAGYAVDSVFGAFVTNFVRSRKRGYRNGYKAFLSY